MVLAPLLCSFPPFIGYNVLDGDIPPEWQKPTSLQYLDLAVGNLDGPIPAELGKLPSLTRCTCTNNLEGKSRRRWGTSRRWCLVYDLMPPGAGRRSGPGYPSHDCHPPVIHRDIKSNNILLDANMERASPISDWHARWPGTNESVSVVAGSYG
ncbi:hypothetical protein PR202_ga06229 [Eleusine coracana subsp. coracana]|uniref:Protein kinase domain-containing protein n=1 Tax=Eleusine coracana subsp. coracana TaxID=191504 RepID=A0AAV5BXV8_ELECO|nr:hypothetical protein PR202_ga06229 [Eleusine coracana subsp. coracana]